SGWSSTELVPLRDRLRYMLLVRAVLIAAVGAGGALGRRLIGVLPPGAFAVLGAGGGVSLRAELVLRLSRGRGLPLLGLTMIVDGLALVWLSTVGNVTNVRYLIFMHMVAVVLLASYRTGLKVAMWYALLLYTVFFAGRNRAFGLSPVHPGTMARWDLGQVAVLVGAVWLVAV